MLPAERALRRDSTRLSGVDDIAGASSDGIFTPSRVRPWPWPRHLPPSA